jgi:membrane AbrB-like protein
VDGRAAGRVAGTLALAAAGAALATLAGLPAAALIGAMLAVGLASLAGLRTEAPGALRAAAFATVGCSLGAGLGPETLDSMARWPASLIALAATTLLTAALTARLLERGFGFAPGAALLAAAPGALSVAVALALERDRSPAAVAALQSMRLAAVTLATPVLLLGVGAATAALPGAAMGAGASVGLVAAAILLGTAGHRIGLPAAHLLAGLALSGALHLTGVVEGRLPPLLTAAGFAGTGAVIGARFAGVGFGGLARFGRAALAAVLFASALTALAALATAAATGQPFGPVWIAFAPGGIEAMAALGLALGYDPAFVAAHHLARILLLVAVLPLWIDRVERRRGAAGRRT